jgi:hypothetical protein
MMVNFLLPKVTHDPMERIAYKGSVSFTVRQLKHFGFQYKELVMNIWSSRSEVSLL